MRRSFVNVVHLIAGDFRNIAGCVNSPEPDAAVLFKHNAFGISLPYLIIKAVFSDNRIAAENCRNCYIGIDNRCNIGLSRRFLRRSFVNVVHLIAGDFRNIAGFVSTPEPDAAVLFKHNAFGIDMPNFLVKAVFSDGTIFTECCCNCYLAVGSRCNVSTGSRCRRGGTVVDIESQSQIAVDQIERIGVVFIDNIAAVYGDCAVNIFAVCNSNCSGKVVGVPGKIVHAGSLIIRNRDRKIRGAENQCQIIYQIFISGSISGNGEINYRVAFGKHHTVISNGQIAAMHAAAEDVHSAIVDSSTARHATVGDVNFCPIT